MLKNITTHLIAGPLGAGKTTLLRQLMQQRPEHERWGILINEFGQVGVDAALLKSQADGIALAEVPGGCLCCVNGLPFQVGLGRLLRKSLPDRLFIEASGLGHPLNLQEQLAAPPWRGVLALQPLVMVLDAQRLAAGEPLPEAQQLALPAAGLVLLNKSAGLDESTRAALLQHLPADCYWCEEANVPLNQLPTVVLTPEPPLAELPPLAPAPLTSLWRSVEVWHCHSQQLDAHYSIGWRMHPAQLFNLTRLQHWLGSVPWLRAKGVVHTDQGWMAFNALPDQPLNWQPSDWRQDNRVELINDHALSPADLERGLRAAGSCD
ncbi:MAG: CobW family GTP-binding protein [Pseudomonas sp.]